MLLPVYQLPIFCSICLVWMHDSKTDNNICMPEFHEPIFHIIILTIFASFTMEGECCRADDIVIVAAQRTPIGSLNGGLSSQKASSLGTVVIKALLEKTNIKPSEISEVILGQALTAGNY